MAEIRTLWTVNTQVLKFNILALRVQLVKGLSKVLFSNVLDVVSLAGLCIATLSRLNELKAQVSFNVFELTKLPFLTKTCLSGTHVIISALLQLLLNTCMSKFTVLVGTRPVSRKIPALWEFFRDYLV